MIRTIIVFIILHIGTPTQAGEITRFGENVITNVIIHEFGHALIREFDLPVLGNEENIADSFTTLFIAQNMPDRAEEIIKDRARSWLFEAKEIKPADYNLKSEYLSIAE